MSSDLGTRTPTDIDTELAGYYGERTTLARKLNTREKELDRYRMNERWYNERDIEKAEADIAELNAHIDVVRAKELPLEGEWERRQWTRAFIVNNTNGHVHKTMACSTCFWDTEFEWLPQYSGHDETEIVEAASALACTVCFPSAPSDVLNRPSSIVTRDKAERDARRAAREQAAAEKAAKKAAKTVRHPQGLPTYGTYGYEADNITSVTSGSVSMVVDILDDKATQAKSGYPYNDTESERAEQQRQKKASLRGKLQTNLEALAAFHGTTVEEQADLIREKGLAKYVKDYSWNEDMRVYEAELKTLRAKNRDRKKAAGK
jgi:hypothetical protein